VTKLWEYVLGRHGAGKLRAQASVLRVYVRPTVLKNARTYARKYYHGSHVDVHETATAEFFASSRVCLGLVQVPVCSQQLFVSNTRAMAIPKCATPVFVLAECGMSEVARKAAASEIVMRAIGIKVMHKQAYILSTYEQFLADSTN
jgi:hypothetical protein